MCLYTNIDRQTDRQTDIDTQTQRHNRKLVDNFSHESDVTSLQDPFTSRPYKTPFYFYYCVKRHSLSNPCRIFAISSTLSLCSCSHSVSRLYGILSDTTSAFTDQPRLRCRKHRSLQIHPYFRAMINLQPQIIPPRCYRTRATSTSVDPTADSKCHALLSARVRPLSELLRLSFPFLIDFDLQETFLRRPSSRVFFFGRLQYSDNAPTNKICHRAPLA